MKTRSTQRKLALWAVVLLLFTVVPLLLLEGATRLYLYSKYAKPGKSYGLWQGDKELGAIHALNGYNSNAETNDYGFRNWISKLHFTLFALVFFLIFLMVFLPDC